MPNYVTKMSKNGSGTFDVMDKGARELVVSEATARGEAIGVEATARENGDNAIKKLISEKSSSIMPSSPTGHGLYYEDGSYAEDAGWSSYYIPVNGGAVYTVTFLGTTHPSNCLNEYDETGAFIKTHGRVGNMTFVSDSNARFIGCAVINRDLGTLNVVQLNVRGEIELVQNNLNGLAEHVSDNGVMTRYSMVDAKTARPFSNVGAGTTFYFGAVDTTDPTITGLSVYGLNTGEASEALASSRFGEGIAKFTTTKSYEYIQVALSPYPSSFTGTVRYDFLVSGVTGLVPRICNLQDGVVSRNLNTKIVRMFQKVTCIGDSYTAGYIWLDGDPDRTIEPMYAWPHFMELETGNKYVNCGVSGANVFTWQEAEDGYQKAVNSGRSQAYIIGLLINDRSQGERGVPLGVPSDIGTDNHTYYAGMSQLIRRINGLNPSAKIFVLTCPGAPIDNGYNIAVRTIVETYKESYPVHCLDLAASRLFVNPTFEGDAMTGHYTGIGYEQMAEVLAYAISKYIGENISDFQNVHQIPFDAD